MKIFLITALLVSNVSISFIEKALNNFDEKSFFISISVKTKNTNCFVIENDDLFWCLKKEKGFDKEEYVSFMKTLLSNGKTLKLKSINSDFKELRKSESVDENAKKGKDHFIKTYFDENRVIKDNVELIERSAIIQKLFEFEVSCLIDDETGYLYISKR